MAVSEVSESGCEVLSAAPTLARFRFLMRSLEPIVLPPYAGSAWRGLLGHGLRRVACVTRQRACDGCMLVHTCLYSTFFESPAAGPQDAEGRYTRLPHPFVLEPEVTARREVGEDEVLALGIALIGPAVEQVPYLIHALHQAGERGLGRSGGRFSLVRVERELQLGGERWDPVYLKETGEYRRLEAAAPVAPPAPSAVGLRLLTPLRIKRHGHFVGPNELEAADLLRNLCARLTLLAELYGGEAAPFDWQRLRPAAEGVRLVEPRLRWHDWTRFSSRQNTLMQLGGLLGDLALEGPALATLWPALWLGQWFHVGKGTSFGLGGYRLDLL